MSLFFSNPPKIPSSANFTSLFVSSEIKFSNFICNKDILGFFGKKSEQITSDGSINSIINLLKSYGLSGETEKNWVQLSQKLIGSTIYDDSNIYQGSSVSLSFDGKTLAVGGNRQDGNIGAAWIFVNISGVWTQQGSRIIGTGAIGSAGQGSSVSLSSDGNTLAIGGSEDDGNIGAAWIFTRNNGIWTQQGPKLVGTGSIGISSQGSSISLSSDGNTLAVGGESDSSAIGATWIFVRNNGIWTQQGLKLVGTGYVAITEQGKSVSLSSDGDTLAIGGPSDDGDIGVAWIFVRNNGIWAQQGSKIIGTGAVGSAGQGSSVSLSSDGNTLAVGGKQDDGNIGATWIFIRNNGIWTQQGSKLTGTGYIVQSRQGSSVSLSSNGNTLAIGGVYDDDNNGALWVFIRNNGIWTQQGPKLVGNNVNNKGRPEQGTSISINGNRDTIAVGGPYDYNYETITGATWIFNYY